MARKSRWQQFADSFNATYGTFNNAFKDIESTRAMNKDYKDEEGNALEGSALESARYKALGDIYTKYGDAEGGLMMRGRYADLQSAEMGNKITRETMDDQIAAAGLGNDLTRARIDSANASTSRSRAATANSVRSAREPTREEGVASVLRNYFGGGGAATELTSPATPSTAPTVPGDVSAAPVSAEEFGLSPVTPTQSPAWQPRVSTSGSTDRGQVPGPNDPGYRGMTPFTPQEDVLQGGAGTDTIGRTDAETKGTQADKPKNKPALASAFTLDMGRKVKKETVTKVVDEVSKQNEADLMGATDALAANGYIDEAKKLLDFVEARGATEAAAAVKASEAFARNVRSGAQKFGYRGVEQAFDTENGPNFSIRTFETEDGLTMATVKVDADGNVVESYPIVSGRNEAELIQKAQALAMNPADGVDLQIKNLELIEKEANIPGGTTEDKLFYLVNEDPYNPAAAMLVAKYLSADVEYAQEYLEGPRKAYDERARQDIERGAGGSAGGGPPPTTEPGLKDDQGAPSTVTQPSPDQRTGGLSGPPSTDSSPSTGSKIRATLRNRQAKPGRGTDVLGVAADRAASAVFAATQELSRARQAGPSGLRGPGAAEFNPQAITQQVFRTLRQDPELSGVPDQDLQSIAIEAVRAISQ